MLDGRVIGEELPGAPDVDGGCAAVRPLLAAGRDYIAGIELDADDVETVVV